jgi:cysteine-rich repeat protein
LHGYFLENLACVEICGDGLLFNLECDDGNDIDNDGCSSSCKIEKNFRCVKTLSNTSQCTYMKKDISLSLKSIYKSDLLDQGIFTFSLTPYLFNIQRLDFSTHLTFQCSQAISIAFAKISYF